MLIEFSAENFRSLKERVTLSLIATNKKEPVSDRDPNTLIVVDSKLSLLRGAAIYGANASGKSNVIKAFALLRRLVKRSAGFQAEESLDIEPFMLTAATQSAPTTLEVVFLLNGAQYRYGFSADSTKVCAEWLFVATSSRESALFTRDGDGAEAPNGITVNRRLFKEGSGVEETTGDNQLFLSKVAANKNSVVARMVREFLVERFAVLEGSNMVLSDAAVAFSKLSPQDQVKTIEFISRFDVDIVNVIAERTLTDGLVVDTLNETADGKRDLFTTLRNRAQEEAETLRNHARNHAQAEVDKLIENLFYYKQVQGLKSRAGLHKERVENTTILKTSHILRDENGVPIGKTSQIADVFLSDGTQKLIALALPIVDALSTGKVLFADEIEARLHPKMTKALVSLFLSPESNPHNAQLIFATHDTNLLDRNLLRRDQIWFCEKERDATRLYSLADFKLPKDDGTAQGVRTEAVYEKEYIEGRYGAVPFLGDISGLFREEAHDTASDKDAVAA